MPTLHWFPGSCARVPLIALEEVGEPFDAQLVDRFDPDAMAAYKREVNAKGKVPAVAIDDRLLTENPAIQTYLARRFPAAGLLPTDPDQQLDALSLMSWFASSIHIAIARTRFPMTFCDVPGSEDRTAAIGLAVLADSFKLVEGRLGEGKWLFPDWTIADAYLLWLWFRAVGSGLDPAPFPRVADHAQRCQQRPSVARALDREEQVYGDLERAGRIPAGLPPHAVGRVPQ